eukprot:365174-Chlamydomonas_euryale.AAC.3
MARLTLRNTSQARAHAWAADVLLTHTAVSCTANMDRVMVHSTFGASAKTSRASANAWARLIWALNTSDETCWLLDRPCHAHPHSACPTRLLLGFSHACNWTVNLQWPDAFQRFVFTLALLGLGSLAGTQKPC